MAVKDGERVWTQLLKENAQLQRRILRLEEQVNRSKQIEEALKISRNVFNSLHSYLIAVNREGMVTRWNTAVEKMTGMPYGEARTKKVWEIIPFLNKYKNDFQHVIQTGTAVELRRQTVFVKIKKYFDISFYPLLFDNEVRGAVIEIEDKTDLVKKDQQLLQAQKMETVGNLAGGLAHDFNNVLGGITGAVSLLRYSLEKNTHPGCDKLMKHISIIETSASRAAAMVKQLLTLSRKKEPSFQPVDLNRTLKHIEKICKNTFDKSIELQFRLYNESAMVNADPIQMEQVLLNLCLNAAHAMTLMRSDSEPWGGILRVFLRKIPAGSSFQKSHQLAGNSGYWLLSVSDTGVGMNTRVMSNIFEPFYTTKRAGKGTGLGMAMVYSIVKQHNALLDIYSEPGKGSTFNLYVPMKKNTGTIKEYFNEDGELPTGSGVILLADDEEVMRETASAMLSNCGYDVIIAKNGCEAIQSFKKNFQSIVLVLLDLEMPKISGKETYMQMKKISKNVKVLLTSGCGCDERVVQLLNMGVCGFIQKPFSLHELAAKIHKIRKESAKESA
ncbi:MAG: response regulator [bacterium]|nr:response regulator [bacterium]